MSEVSNSQTTTSKEQPKPHAETLSNLLEFSRKTETTPLKAAMVVTSFFPEGGIAIQGASHTKAQSVKESGLDVSRADYEKLDIIATRESKTEKITKVSLDTTNATSLVKSLYTQLFDKDTRAKKIAKERARDYVDSLQTASRYATRYLQNRNYSELSQTFSNSNEVQIERPSIIVFSSTDNVQLNKLGEEFDIHSNKFTSSRKFDVSLPPETVATTVELDSGELSTLWQKAKSNPPDTSLEKAYLENHPIPKGTTISKMHDWLNGLKSPIKFKIAQKVSAEGSDNISEKELSEMLVVEQFVQSATNSLSTKAAVEIANEFIPSTGNGK